jgi:hypothetical protein
MDNEKDVEKRQAELDSLFDDTKKIRFGCVMFDLQEAADGKYIPYPGSGWASIQGGSAFRIKSTSDLSSDVKWLTNLSLEILWKSGAHKQQKLKHSGYLRTELGQIMKELGLTPPKIPIAEVCEKISALFNKVMRLSIEFYGVKSFNNKDLLLEIRNELFKEDANISIALDEALTRAYQDLVICETPILKDKQLFVTLKRPRYTHAQAILDVSLPIWNGDWNFYGSRDLPPSNEKKIEFLMNLGNPFLAKISINRFYDDVSLNVDLGKLLDLGEAMGEGGKTKDRNWVCQPELLYLCRFADVNIEAAFVADGYKELDIKLPFLGDLSAWSYSLGLLAENVWMSLSTRSVNPQTRAKTLVSPRACWLKAADRFMTLTSAMMLSSAGFVVSSYGYGGVTIMLDESKIGELIELAPHAGLTVPMSIIDKRIVRIK